MTTTVEIITVVCAVIAALGVVGGGFAFSTHFSNRLAFAERDSGEALEATKVHTVQIALAKDHAETALNLGQDHTRALSENGARMADAGARLTSMEGTYSDIRKSLEKIDGIKEDINEMKSAVSVLTSQMADTRTDVQTCQVGITALNKVRRSTSSKKRKR